MTTRTTTSTDDSASRPSGECRQRPTARIDGRVITDNPRLRLWEDRVVMPSGREAVHWKVDYKLKGVGIIPVLADGRVLLGLHHRYCPDTWGWEIAAGGVDPGEDRDETARRELVEETGYSAGKIELILDFHPAPGLGNEHFHAYLATDLRKVVGETDPDEIHDLRAFSWDEIEDLIDRREITDGFTLTALLFARNRGLIG